MKVHIHKFRNALVKVIDTESHKYCHLPRWEELNSFPFGSCDVANNMLAAYLRQKGFEPKIVWCDNNHDDYPNIKSHVWIDVEDKFVDITINQFPDYTHKRVHIASKNDPNMLNEIYKHSKEQGHHHFRLRDIDLSASTSSSSALFKEVVKIADAL